MKGYGVHLLFHTLCGLTGATLGGALALWWLSDVASAKWVFFGATALGIILLVLQALYIRGTPVPDREPLRPEWEQPSSPPWSNSAAQRASRSHGGTRPRVEPVEHTRVLGNVEDSTRSDNP